MHSDFTLFLNMEAPQPQEVFPLRFSEKLAQNKRPLIAFAIIVIVASALLAFVSQFLSPTLAKLFQLAVFFLLGYVHLSMLRGALSVLDASERLWYSLFMAALVIGLLFGVGLFTHRFNPFLIVASGAAFLLLFIIDETWQQYNLAADGPVQSWQYTPDLPLNQSTVFLNSLPIRVKVQTDEHGREEMLIHTRAPVRMKLGLIFYHMVQDQKGSGRLQIALADTKEHSYKWIFFAPRLIGWDRPLNPEVGLVENGIKENALIVARRISHREIAGDATIEKQTKQKSL